MELGLLLHPLLLHLHIAETAWQREAIQEFSHEQAEFPGEPSGQQAVHEPAVPL